MSLSPLSCNVGLQSTEFQVTFWLLFFVLLYLGTHWQCLEVVPSSVLMVSSQGCSGNHVMMLQIKSGPPSCKVYTWPLEIFQHGSYLLIFKISFLRCYFKNLYFLSNRCELPTELFSFNGSLILSSVTYFPLFWLCKVLLSFLVFWNFHMLYQKESVVFVMLTEQRLTYITHQ